MGEATREMKPADRMAHKFGVKVIRGAVVGLAMAFVVSALTGFFHVPKGDAMGYTFYIGILVGLTSFIVPVREKGRPNETP